MIRINLFKPEKKEILPVTVADIETRKEPGEKKSNTPSLILLLVIVIIIALSYMQKTATSRERNRLEAVQTEKKKLTDVLTKLEELERQKTMFEQKISLINYLKAEREIAVRIMDELSRNLKEWVWLTEVSYENRLLKVKGRALSNNLIADYIASLEDSEIFDSVSLIDITQRTARNEQFLEFSLTANYGPPGLPPPPAPPEKAKPQPATRGKRA